MSRPKFSRRTMLRGAGVFGAVGMALPILPSITRSADNPFPRRLLIMHSGNGTIRENWNPIQDANGDERKFELHTILEPLKPHQNDLLVLEGLDLRAARECCRGFHAHERGLGGILTGQILDYGSFEAGSGYALGISVDQHIANALQGQTDLHSLQLGIINKDQKWKNRVTFTYRGSRDPIYAENDPYKINMRVFGSGATANNAAYEEIRARRQSVLDYVQEDMKRVERELSSRDRRRLDQHNEAFRDLERLLSEPPPNCEGPNLPNNLNFMNENNIDLVADLQIKQAVQAFACDRTRVATLQFGAGLGALSMRAVGYTDSWHAVSHEGDGNNTAKRKLTEMNTYIAGLFAKILDEMKAIPEGDGTLLDNSIVIWVNELGKGNNHDHDDVPIVIAGSGQGFFDVGRHVTFGQRNTNDLLISLCHAFGLQDQTFGIAELCRGPLTELHA